jgi:hypothetical protein
MASTPVTTLAPIDYVVMAVYFAAVLGVGWVLRRVMRSSTDFFLSGRSLSAWVTGIAFISANLGAQEVIGMGASGAKYGIATSHFYWVGAIPAMVFVGLFMMPFYYGSRARSVPEYLRLRFDENPAAERCVLCPDDDLLIGRLDVRHGEALQSAARVELRRECPGIGPHRARLCPARRPDQRDLQ